MAKHTVSTIPCACGIDVSKASLSIALNFGDGIYTAHEIKNTKEDMLQFAAQHLAGFTGRIVIESTGRFSLEPTLALSEAGFDVRLINPLMTKKYATSAIRKLKTDKADAKLLALMAMQETNLPPRFVSDRKTVHIRKKMSLINALTKNIQQLKATLKNYEATAETLGIPLSETEHAIGSTIRELNKQKERLTREVEMAGRETNTDTMQRLMAIPGVSGCTAALVTLLCIPAQATSPKQWIAYVGMDVSVKESGTWKGKCALTKRGNSTLRRRLYAAAWGACMANPKFKEYYAHVKKQGRHHFEILIIIARKLLRIMFSIVKQAKAYDPAIPLFATA